MGASTLILIVVSPINLALNVYAVHFTSLRLLGSPLTISITYWLCFICLGVWTYRSPTHKRNGTWGGIQIGTVLNPLSCYQFLKLALPGILMVGTEWLDILSPQVKPTLIICS
jgi:multidrug resistance protein, MATE family